MNILKFPLWAIVAIILMAACENDTPEPYYYTLGILNIRNDSAIIETDDNSTLYIQNKSSVIPDFQDGDRIEASFQLVNQDLPEGIDYVIRIDAANKVLFKPVIEFKEEEADSLGNDPIQIDRIWLAKDYINLNFSYLGGQTAHNINMVYYPDTLQTDTIVVEIMHNAKNDDGTYSLSSFVSFDLSPIQPADSVVLRVLSSGFNGQDFDDCVIYKNPN